MKTIMRIGIAVILSAFFISCLGKSSDKKGESPFSKLKETTNALKSTGEALKNTKNVLSKADEIKEKVEKLAKIEPLEASKIKSWLPEEIKGFKRTSYKTGDTEFMGVTSVEATYKNEENQSFSVKLFDGAGSGAALLSGVFYGYTLNREEETENGYSKIIEKNGYRAIEKMNTRQETAEISFIEADRFHVELGGKGMEPQDLWELVGLLNTQALENL